MVQGRKSRPQKRWDDDIREVAGAMWNRVAQDRAEWKRLGGLADWNKHCPRTEPCGTPILTADPDDLSPLMSTL
ncbi:hypothetical protein EVAR_68587_1 [Eumeta japonica]|uniref:Uncharacterized protein n=1 Tax=Eumeta variegata TaxID=151549 RepID=A0A4C2A3N5_EUMVA|nr:hypothetical protein EVAR_68587_1 [Eumeta japonica]